MAFGRKNYSFVSSEGGGKAAAIPSTLIETAKLDAVDFRAWVADTLAVIADYKITKVNDLLPWCWNGSRSDRTVTRIRPRAPLRWRLLARPPPPLPGTLPQHHAINQFLTTKRYNNAKHHGEMKNHSNGVSLDPAILGRCKR